MRVTYYKTLMKIGLRLGPWLNPTSGCISPFPPFSRAKLGVSLTLFLEDQIVGIHAEQNMQGTKGRAM